MSKRDSFFGNLRALQASPSDTAYRTLYWCKQLFLAAVDWAREEGKWEELEGEWLPFSMKSTGVDFPLEWTARIVKSVSGEAAAAVKGVVVARPVLAARLAASRMDGAGHYVYFFPRSSMEDGLHPGWDF